MSKPETKPPASPVPRQSVAEITRALAEPFNPTEVKFKPGEVLFHEGEPAGRPPRSLRLVELASGRGRMLMLDAHEAGPVAL